MFAIDGGDVVKPQLDKKKGQYEKPQVISKRVEFMTSTFSTEVVKVRYGSFREAPER
jgi:hypothetical protein